MKFDPDNEKLYKSIELEKKDLEDDKKKKKGDKDKMSLDAFGAIEDDDEDETDVDVEFHKVTKGEKKLSYLLRGDKSDIPHKHCMQANEVNKKKESFQKLSGIEFEICKTEGMCPFCNKNLDDIRSNSRRNAGNLKLDAGKPQDPNHDPANAIDPNWLLMNI